MTKSSAFHVDTLTSFQLNLKTEALCATNHDAFDWLTRTLLSRLISALETGTSEFEIPSTTHA